MKLYDVPRNTKIRVVDESAKTAPFSDEADKQEVLYFHHIDGMYSFCENMQGEIIHLAAWTEVDIVKE